MHYEGKLPVSNVFRPLLQKIHPVCPQKRSTRHIDPCLDLLESICNLCIFLRFWIIQCIHLYPSITSFLNIYLQKIYIDCRKKPHSIKSERIEGVNWKYWWKISISLEFLRNLKFAYHYCKENPSMRVFDCLTINMWLKGYNCQQSVNKNQTQAADWWKLENRIRFVIWNRNLLDSKNIQIVVSSK